MCISVSFRMSTFPSTESFPKVLQKGYCDNIQPEDNNINTDTLQIMKKKLLDNQYPGNDLIVRYWYKDLTFYRNDLAELCNKTFTGLIEIPMWMEKAKTLLLLLKNDQANHVKTYRPLALQNMMVKLYTDCMNQFLQDHCQLSNIITTEQVGGRKNCGNALSN